MTSAVGVRRAWWACGILVVVHAILILSGILDADGVNLAGNYLLTLEPALATVACTWAGYRTRGTQAVAWYFFGVACASWTLGQAIWVYYERILDITAPYPSWADAGYLGFNVFAAVGLIVCVAPSMRRISRVRALLDALLIFGALFFITWITVLSGPVRDAFSAFTTTGSTLAHLLAVAYPLLNMVLVGLVFLTMPRFPPDTRPSFGLVALGGILFAVADGFYLYLATAGTYRIGNPIDLGWALGFLLIAVGGVRAALRAIEASAKPAKADRFAAFFPYIPLIASVVVASVMSALGARADSEVGSFLGLLVIVAFVRQFAAVSETQQLRRDVEDALERLRATERQRLQMLNNVAHDLNNPLTPVAIQVAVLRQAPGVQEDHAESLNILERNVRRLKLLISDLRDVGILEAGKLRIQPRYVDVAALIADAINSSQDYARAHGVELRGDANQSLPVTADPDRISQVLDNLLRNAIKFTPKGGQVEVSAESVADAVQVRVRDTGRGLTPSEITRLFRAFSQVHQPDEASEKGTGLGLFICRGILEAHGGRVWAESEGRGSGSSFVFELPRDSGAPPPGQEAVRE